MTNLAHNLSDVESEETREWLESLDYVLQHGGPERVKSLLKELQIHAYETGVRMPFTANTPYLNTIPVNKQPIYPGNREIERKIKNIIRWNATIMVLRANRGNTGVGGHLATFASSATLLEVGFNHFFKGASSEYGGDLLYLQGHASPGIYSRAFMEGRLSEDKLNNFRRELKDGGGLSSYPHPRLMPDFWQFPTVSMGLGPITSIYQARFTRYLENRKLKPNNGGKIWAFLGDGETDEPETLGAIHLAAREGLDNLVFVVNCNLQRLDGPVRGNGSIIQDLEGIFRGAGWNVIKVIWGDKWDPLFEKDNNGILLKRAEEVVDGEYQKYSVEEGSYIRKHFFGKYPELSELINSYSDEQLRKLNRGGHDPEKVYAAYKAATEHTGAPTVVLVKTVKGYGLGKTAEGKNAAHQQKKLSVEELKGLRDRCGLPISNKEVEDMLFYLPSKDSEEMQYLHARRKELNGYLPKRSSKCISLGAPKDEFFKEFFESKQKTGISTTMAFVRILTKLLKDPELGKHVVPIVPDEARTFGMEALFRQAGIYASKGQLYEPVDSGSLLYYKESKDGQILEEGINEAGAVSSFIAAGTSYSNHGIPMIPFYIYYSMFGFQRIGDFAWAAGDAMTRGFLLGGTSGRTTLNGEGLQHQDGHSLLQASTIPSVVAYDPSFAYEVALIVQEGIRRMYDQKENIYFYITLCNENYVMPPMPKDIREGVLKGIYKYQPSKLKKGKAKTHLLGSGTIINCVIEAQSLLETYGVSADVWSVTSYVELRKAGLDSDRKNLLNAENKKSIPYLTDLFSKEEGVCVAASDYMKVLPDSISKWLPLKLTSLGTDGYGRSETREALREYFEIDANFIAYTAIVSLVEEGMLPKEMIEKVKKDLKIDSNKLDPMSV